MCKLSITFSALKRWLHVLYVGPSVPQSLFTCLIYTLFMHMKQAFVFHVDYKDVTTFQNFYTYHNHVYSMHDLNALDGTMNETTDDVATVTTSDVETPNLSTEMAILSEGILHTLKVTYTTFFLYNT